MWSSRPPARGPWWAGARTGRCRTPEAPGAAGRSAVSTRNGAPTLVSARRRSGFSPSLPQLFGVAGRTARDAAVLRDVVVAHPPQRRRVHVQRGGDVARGVSHVVDA